MKNIHTLPTNKTSRLQSNRYSKLFLSEVHKAYADCINQNIYITSDEEIKFNDYITDGYKVWQWKDDSSLLGRKKIILTTDQDLIKDGVQAIDDEFLEWFVKNPSCEEVEVKKSFADGSTFGYGYIENLIYKIIIPKQETLEEAIDSYIYKNSTELNLPDILTNAIMFGAKFQNELILDFLHSEITERRDYSASKMCEKIIEFIKNK